MQKAQALDKPILPLLSAGEPFLTLATTQYENVADGRMPGTRWTDDLREAFV